MDVFVIHCQISHYWWPGNPRTRTARAMRLSRIIPSWVLEIVICDGKNVFCRTVVRFLCPRMNNCLRVLISVLMSVMQNREKKSHFLISYLSFIWPMRRHALHGFLNMMASSNENIFRVTGLCAGNSPVRLLSKHLNCQLLWHYH